MCELFCETTAVSLHLIAEASTQQRGPSLDVYLNAERPLSSCRRNRQRTRKVRMSENRIIIMQRAILVGNIRTTQLIHKHTI